ncbi:sulfite exporter TauE/SafE family protein [Haloferula sargassicola]|uniref:Probable membrane transporter protein n=1 Tax=Haloferula sargassicola TaxID=490096 RepID=A0ABP9URC6_9BACT
MISGWENWLLAAVAAFCIGVAKSGFSGTSMIAVAIFTQMFGAKAQAGFGLPLLLIADLCVFPAYRKHGNWADVWKLLPATFVGLAAGWWLLGHLEETTARRLIGGLILLMLALQGLRFAKPGLLEKIAGHRAFGTGAGVAAGTTTMLANAAGPIFQLYLLSRRIPKMELIGIGARFFPLVNFIKIPLNRSLGTINSQTVTTGLMLAPAIVAGVFIGKSLLHRVPQRVFEWMILAFAAVAAIRMFV